MLILVNGLLSKEKDTSLVTKISIIGGTVSCFLIFIVQFGKLAAQGFFNIIIQLNGIFLAKDVAFTQYFASLLVTLLLGYIVSVIKSLPFVFSYVTRTRVWYVNMDRIHGILIYNDTRTNVDFIF